MADLADIANRLRHRAHVHSDACRGRYEPCGEHHVHDDTCGSRPLACRRIEDPDLVTLLGAYKSQAQHMAQLEIALINACAIGSGLAVPDPGVPPSLVPAIVRLHALNEIALERAPACRAKSCRAPINNDGGCLLHDGGEIDVEVENRCGLCGETFTMDASDSHWSTGRGPICPKRKAP